MSLLWGVLPTMSGSCAHLPGRLTSSNACSHAPRSSLHGRPVVQKVAAVRQQRAARSQSLTTLAQAAKAAEGAPREAVSHLRFTRGSHLKFQRVLDQIRGRSYPEALFLLEHMPYRACEPLKDLLIGVAADAKHNFQMQKARLFVSECYANQAGIIKRFRPRARGRGYRIKKGVSHITMKVREGVAVGEEEAELPKAEAGTEGSSST